MDNFYKAKNKKTQLEGPDSEKAKTIKGGLYTYWNTGNLNLDQLLLSYMGGGTYSDEAVINFKVKEPELTDEEKKRLKEEAKEAKRLRKAKREAKKAKIEADIAAKQAKTNNKDHQS